MFNSYVSLPEGRFKKIGHNFCQWPFEEPIYWLKFPLILGEHLRKLCSRLARLAIGIEWDIIWLVVYLPTPLKNDGVSESQLG